MRIGVYLRLLGRPGSDPRPPDWASLREHAMAAEATGFDIVVLEDAALYSGADGDRGVWESTTIAAAIAASTSRVRIGHAVINNPYRQPSLTARIAVTLDEISGGRYTLGIGLGNTPDDYPRFGVDADQRFARFEESIAVIRALVRGERTTFHGRYVHVEDAELVLRGPSRDGPPIAIAAGKPKMLRLAARFGDEWNWWVQGRDAIATLQPIVEEFERACSELGRDPASIRRSIDVFSVRPPGDIGDDDDELGGTEETIARALLAYRSLGIAEVRLDLRPRPGMPMTDAISAMGGLVARLHNG